MPVDLWKEVFLNDNPEPQLVELFTKTVIMGTRGALDEASRRVRYEAKPDTVVVWRDPVPLVAVASIHYAEGSSRLKIVIVEGNPLLEELVASIRKVLGSSLVMPVKYPTGFGRERIRDSIEKLARFVKGAAAGIVDVTDAPGIFGAVFHRAGIRHYTIVRRKGYEVLVEKVSV